MMKNQTPWKSIVWLFVLILSWKYKIIARISGNLPVIYADPAPAEQAQV